MKANTASVQRLIDAIERLPSDAPFVEPGKWYRTQKQHWLGWLREYDTPGAYGRKPGMNRDARYAYNHIVEPKMLLWLLPAAGVDLKHVRIAKRRAALAKTMPGASAAIRRQVPWNLVEDALWPRPAETRSVRQFIRSIQELPADPPLVQEGIWYTTQKQHWLGWLNEYHTSGAYGRKAGQSHDARYVFNHIVNPQMLLWLIGAAGLPKSQVRAARVASTKAKSMPAQAGAIRRVVPWEAVAARLWPDEAG